MTTLSDHFRYRTLLDRLSDPNDYYYDAELQKWIKNDDKNDNNKIKCNTNYTMFVITVIAVVLLCIKLLQYSNDEMIVFDRRNLMMEEHSNPQTTDEKIEFTHKYVMHSGFIYQDYIKLTSIPTSMSALLHWNERGSYYHSVNVGSEGSMETLIPNYIKFQFLKTGRLVRDCQQQKQEQKPCIFTFNCDTKHWDYWSCNFLPQEETVRTVHYWDSWFLQEGKTYHNQALYPGATKYESLEPYNTQNITDEGEVYEQLINTMVEKVEMLNLTSCIKNTKEDAPYALCNSAVVPGAVMGAAGMIVGGVCGFICDFFRQGSNLLQYRSTIAYASMAAGIGASAGGAFRCDHKHYRSVVCKLKKLEIQTDTVTRRQNPPKIRNKKYKSL